MLTVLRSLRALRITNQLTKLPENVSSHFSSSKIYGLRSSAYNLHQSHELGLKRLFSVEANPNQDPLTECHSIYPLNPVQIEELSGNDPVEIKKLRVLQMELAVRRVQHPNAMPQRISLEQWRDLLTLSRSGQVKYLVTVMKKEKRFKKPDLPAGFERFESDNMKEFGHDTFFHGLFRNAMFPLLHDNTISAAMNTILLNALQFAPPLIMDCGFENVMTVREVKNLCQQLACCLNSVRNARDPYNLVFCNLQRDSLMGETLWSAMPNIYDDDLPLITSEKCYTDLYPKDRLVYLTPHCRETVDFNINDIYVIGAMVDKSNPGPHSMIKAKAQGIRMGCFPIDKYLVWKKGTKSLTLNQVIDILLRMKSTRDWAYSFQRVPKRKVTDVMSYRGFNKTQRRYQF